MSVRECTVRVAAEWEPQSCVWLAWPHNQQTWPGRFDEIPDFFARWIRSVAESTPVRLLADSSIAGTTERHLGDCRQVEIVAVPTNDCWIRDYGPTFVVDRHDGGLRAIDWQYNAWGGKYPPWDDDHAAAARICRHQSIDSVSSNLCVEGGAMEFDGTGRLMTTIDCLRTPTRNPGWNQLQIEDELKRLLGVHEILWLSGGGIEGDDTDGHIDQLARFVDAENVVAAVCDDADDPNHQPLNENFRQLIQWSLSTSPRVAIHALPIPPRRDIDGQRVPESYCNFLRLGPDRIQVPVFGAATDDRAVAILRELAGIDVEPIDCRDLVWGLGTLHCASRDQPCLSSIV